MGSKGRRRKSNAASVSGGQPEDNTGGHHPESFDSAAAEAAGPEEDFDAAVAEAAAGSRRGLPERYVFPPDWWETHDLYEFPDDYFEFAARQTKTDPRFNAGRNKYLEWPEKERREFNALSDRLEILEKEISEIEKVRLEIKREIDKLELIPDTPLDEHFIIAFVKEIESEIQYLKFEKYLKRRVDILHDSDALDVFKMLVQKERMHESYKKLDYKGIMNAISVRIRDLQNERDRELKPGKENISTSLEEDKKEFWMLSALHEDSDEDLSSNPIGDIVKAIHQKKYYMHWDPLNELKKIEKYNPQFYFKYFLAKVLMKYSETRVVIGNVPDSYHEVDVIDLLSVCGRITHVELDQGEPWTKIANVTFKYPEGARLAPILMDQTILSIYPVPEPRKFTLDEETQRKFEKALKKYGDFRHGMFKRRFY